MTVWAFDLPLTTDRLRLRAHRTEDLDDLVVFHGDPLVTRYIPWPTRTREQTREALAVKLGRTRAAAPGDWIVLAVEERSTGTVVGEVLVKREEEDGRAEVGYALRTDRQGQGLASEAVTALLDAAAEAFGVVDVRAIVVDGNDASARLLVRLGFEPIGPGPADDDETTTEFRRLRP
jgi:RimJ/RimL family protein N-acetyltransferase